MRPADDRKDPDGNRMLARLNRSASLWLHLLSGALTSVNEREQNMLGYTQA
jgi:hypothetical protein